jgi:anti-sigma B factor antagonist
VSNDEIVPGFDDEMDDILVIRLERIEKLDAGLLIALDGYLNSYNRKCFERRVTKAIDAGFARLVFDLQRRVSMSDLLLGSFLVFLKLVKPRGGDLVLIRIDPRAHEVMKLLGFAQYFNVEPTLAEAVAVFAGTHAPAAGEPDVSVPGFPAVACENLEIPMRSLESIPDGLLVTPRGYVDRYNHRCFSGHIDRAIAAGRHRLVFDLRDVEWAGDAIVTTMIGFHKAVTPLGGTIVLCGLQPAVMEVITLLGLSGFFTIRQTLAEALEFITAGPKTTDFALVFNCPVCDHKARAPRAGRFRCKTCRSVLGVRADGSVMPEEPRQP